MKPIVFIGVFVAILAGCAAANAQAPAAGAKGDGKLSIYNYHENEFLETTYRSGARVDPNSIAKIRHIFRSRGAAAPSAQADSKGGEARVAGGVDEHAIDIRLIELVDLIGDHFGADSIELISGYRSPAYNSSLKAEGRGVASESLHTQGLAADIHIDEVTEEEIFDYARSLGRGGVGIYPRYGFVHVDVGPVRSWREAEPAARILLGTENNPNPAWSAVTDRNIYRAGNELFAEIRNNDYAKQKYRPSVWIERFRRGEWGSQEKIEEIPDGASLAPGESTRYSWRIPEGQGAGRYRLVIFASRDFSLPPFYSNEFYVKRGSAER